MQAALTKITKSGTKIIHGKVLQRGLGVITLVVPSKDGQQKIKRFKEADYAVRVW